MAIAINGSGTITGLAVGGLPDGSVDADTLAADCIDESKIANNGIDSEHYNAGSVDLSHLSATGTASSSTFLRGDNAWAAPAAGGGIDNAVVFRKAADTTGNCLPVTDWEKEDGLYLPGEVGTFSAPSSGVFTFPSTGYWYMIAVLSAVNGSSVSNTMWIQILVTIDNGGYWSNNSINQNGAAASGHASATTTHLLDVTDLSNHKVKINLGAHYGSEVMKGDSTSNETHVTFIRLGDT